MKINFITGNPKKFEEVKQLFEKEGFEVEWIKIDKPEQLEEDDIEKIASFSARILADQIGKPIVCEDTGVYFEAFDDFPGAHSKWIFTRIGYDGIFRLIDGKKRGISYRTAVAYCLPGEEAKVFVGETKGSISNEVKCKEKDLDKFPYDRIFIPEGHDKVFGEHMEWKSELSQRAKAIKKLIEYFKSQ